MTGFAVHRWAVLVVVVVVVAVVLRTEHPKNIEIVDLDFGPGQIYPALLPVARLVLIDERSFNAPVIIIIRQATDRMYIPPAAPGAAWLVSGSKLVGRATFSSGSREHGRSLARISSSCEASGERGLGDSDLLKRFDNS